MPILETENLTKIYSSGILKRKNITALKGVSIAVEPGEIFGLLGPNGAGKTTFIKLLLSIAHPTSGSAKVFDVGIGNVEIQKKTGYLPENHRYPPFLSAAETLRFFGQIHRMSSDKLRTRVTYLLQLVGLQDWANVKVKKFSKGMLQRLGLAQSLINDPDLLFLDEPTDGVDPIGRKEIRNLLLDLKSQGKTIFLNSHLLSEVESISDRVVILNKGEVIKTGLISDLTELRSEYDIRYEGSCTEATFSRLSALGKVSHGELSSLSVYVESTESLNAMIDILRQEQIRLLSLTPKKSTLEDYFINLIRKENNAQ
ncbi:MAG: ABC transporter ATP-binding protein [bacterium]